MVSCSSDTSKIAGMVRPASGPLVARELVRAVGQLQRGASEPRNWKVLTAQLGADGRPLTGERRRA